jgi:2-(1,2-epoxy-1,2-dihydrophenyl)acetyl-CoA isomerase
MASSVLGTTVLHEVVNGVSTITLNRPDAANALLPEMRDVLIDLLSAADPDTDIRAVSIRRLHRQRWSRRAAGR